MRGEKFIFPPIETAFGSLYKALRMIKDDFQPTNINFSLFPPIDVRMGKKEKREKIVLRAKEKFDEYFKSSFSNPKTNDLQV